MNMKPIASIVLSIALLASVFAPIGSAATAKATGKQVIQPTSTSINDQCLYTKPGSNKVFSKVIVKSKQKCPVKKGLRVERVPLKGEKWIRVTPKKTNLPLITIKPLPTPDMMQFSFLIKPIATPSPEPTPEPTAVPSIDPNATPVTAPSEAPTVTPEVTATPSPTPTPTPVATATPDRSIPNNLALYGLKFKDGFNNGPIVLEDTLYGNKFHLKATIQSFYLYPTKVDGQQTKEFKAIVNQINAGTQKIDLDFANYYIVSKMKIENLGERMIEGSLINASPLTFNGFGGTVDGFEFTQWYKEHAFVIASKTEVDFDQKLFAPKGWVHTKEAEFVWASGQNIDYFKNGFGYYILGKPWNANNKIIIPIQSPTPVATATPDRSIPNNLALYGLKFKDGFNNGPIVLEDSLNGNKFHLKVTIQSFYLYPTKVDGQQTKEFKDIVTQVNAELPSSEKINYDFANYYIVSKMKVENLGEKMVVSTAINAAPLTFNGFGGSVDGFEYTQWYKEHAFVVSSYAEVAEDQKRFNSRGLVQTKEAEFVWASSRDFGNLINLSNAKLSIVFFGNYNKPTFFAESIQK